MGGSPKQDCNPCSWLFWNFNICIISTTPLVAWKFSCTCGTENLQVQLYRRDKQLCWSEVSSWTQCCFETDSHHHRLILYPCRGGSGYRIKKIQLYFVLNGKVLLICTYEQVEFKCLKNWFWTQSKSKGAVCLFVMTLYILCSLWVVAVFLLQGYGTATGSMITTSKPLLPYLTLVSPPTSMFTCKSKRPGWPSVSLMEMLLIFFDLTMCYFILIKYFSVWRYVFIF